MPPWYTVTFFWFIQPLLDYILWTSGIWRRVIISYIDTKVSEEYASSIFRAESLKMAVVCPSETLLHIHQTTQITIIRILQPWEPKNLHSCTPGHTTINIRHILFLFNDAMEVTRRPTGEKVFEVMDYECECVKEFKYLRVIGTNNSRIRA
jgi:hypothetical protein